jgi:hypothetical protein
MRIGTSRDVSASRSGKDVKISSKAVELSCMADMAPLVGPAEQLLHVDYCSHFSTCAADLAGLHELWCSAL